MTSQQPGVKLSSSLRKLLVENEDDSLIISPPLREFLVRWDGTVPRWVAKRILELLVQPQRDRSGSWSASSAGMCLRRQEFKFLGAPEPGPVDVQKMQFFNNGRWVHLRWQATLLTAAILDGIETTVRKPSLLARCTLDGIGTALEGRYQGQDFGFELKGRNDYAFNTQERQGPDEKTRKQVDFQIMLTGLDLFVILNENKNNQLWREWVFYRDDERIADARSELVELNKAIDRQRLHPMLPECKAKTGEFKTCPFGGSGGVCINSGGWVK